MPPKKRLSKEDRDIFRDKVAHFVLQELPKIKEKWWWDIYLMLKEPNDKTAREMQEKIVRKGLALLNKCLGMISFAYRYNITSEKPAFRKALKIIVEQMQFELIAAEFDRWGERVGPVVHGERVGKNKIPELLKWVGYVPPEPSYVHDKSYFA